MLILLKKEKIISFAVTICVIVGLLFFANANRTENNMMQVSTNVTKENSCSCNNCNGNCINNCMGNCLNNSMGDSSSVYTNAANN